MKLISLFYILCLNFIVLVKAYAGIMPSQSRIIYQSTDKESAIMLANTNDYPVIVQNWIDNGEGDPNVTHASFVSIPPIFRLDPLEVKGVRIIYNQTALPQNQESLFWFNIYEIPPDPKIENDNAILITMNTQIKLFFRPKGINIIPEMAIKQVHCSVSKGAILICKNPTPIYLSIVSINSEPQNNEVAKPIQDSFMLAPFSQKEYQLMNKNTLTNDLYFYYINDQGESLKEKIKIIK